MPNLNLIDKHHEDAGNNFADGTKNDYTNMILTNEEIWLEKTD